MHSDGLGPVLPANAAAVRQTRAQAQTPTGIQIRGCRHLARPAITTVTETTRYGSALASAWGQPHPLLVRRSAWADHPEGELPVNAGTVVHFHVDHLPWEQDPKPV